MDDPVEREDRIVVGRHVGGLAAAALVDGDVDEDGTGFHFLEILLFKELRGGGARDQDRADDEIRIPDRALDVRVGGDQGLDPCPENVIEVLKSL